MRTEYDDTRLSFKERELLEGYGALIIRSRLEGSIRAIQRWKRRHPKKESVRVNERKREYYLRVLSTFKLDILEALNEGVSWRKIIGILRSEGALVSYRLVKRYWQQVSE